MKRNCVGCATFVAVLLIALWLHAGVAQARWRFGDERYYNDFQVCRDGMILGLADSTGNTPPVLYNNIGAVLYTTGFTPLPTADDSSTYAPASSFGSFVSSPQLFQLPQQSAPITMPDTVQTSVYITATLRWSQLLTPGQIVVLSRDNTVNGRSDNDAFFSTTISDCYLVAPPTIAAQPTDQTVVSGQQATLHVDAAGGAPLSYQWYQGAQGDTSTPVGANAASYTTPALTATTSYWVRISNATGQADSAAVTVTVTPLPTTTPLPTATPPPSGTPTATPLPPTALQRHTFLPIIMK